ncbi:MAG: TIGR04076 family protein [Candidatus Methanomethylicaceae archaeon]
MLTFQRWAYTIQVTLIKSTGVCAAGHKVGDKWVFPGDTEIIQLEKGICIHALASMLYKIIAMRYGVNFPWLKSDPDVAFHLCPDASNPHVFEIKRVKNE